MRLIRKIQAQSSSTPSTDLAEFLSEGKKLLDGQGGKLMVFQRDGLSSPRYIGEMDLAAAVQSESFLSGLNQTHGDGDYILKLAKPSSKVVKEFSFLVGKPKKGRSPADDPSNRGASSSYNAAMSQMMSVMMEQNKALIQALAGNGKGQGDIVEAMKVAVEMTNANRQSMDEIMAVLLQSALQSGNDPISQVREVFSLAREMQPQVEQQDGMMGLLQSALGFLMTQAGGRGAPSGVNPAQFLQALGQMQPSPPGHQAAGAPVSSAFSGAPAAPPSGPGQRASGVPFSGVVQAAPETSPEDPHRAFYAMMIKPFRAEITAGAAPEVLAQKILSMVNAAALWQTSNPHPLVADLITAQDPFALNAAFSKFCGSIPELSQNKELQRKVKEVLQAWIAASVRAKAAAQQAGDLAGEEVDEEEYVDEYPEGAHVEDTEGDQGEFSDQDRGDGEPVAADEPDEDDPASGE
jgi:hypothetical protein